MAYLNLIDIGEIESFFPGLEFNEDSSPTSFDVELWIVEATALVYSAIAETYAVPVTDEDALAVLRIPARMYVLQNVKYVLAQNSRNSIDKKNVKNIDGVDHSAFFDFLSKITDGTLKLPNTSDASSDRVGASHNASNDITFTFDSKTDNW